MRFCRHSGGGRHTDGRQPDLSLSRGGLHNSSFIGDDTRRCVLSAEGTCCTMSGVRMKERGLKNISVVDQESRPLDFFTHETFCKFFSKIRRRGINVARLGDGRRLVTATSCQTSGQNEVVGQSSETQLPIFDLNVGSPRIPTFSREARQIW